MPEGLETYIEQIRASRAEFRESVAAVRASLDGTSAGGDVSRTRVLTALAELRHRRDTRDIPIVFFNCPVDPVKAGLIGTSPGTGAPGCVAIRGRFLSRGGLNQGT